MKHYLSILIFIVIIFSACTSRQSQKNSETIQTNHNINTKGISLVILGTIQDAGCPQIACKKECCTPLFKNPDPNKKVVSLGLVDNINNKKYLFDATPDITSQMKALVRDDVKNTNELVDGIFLTHAHIGHYAGLMYLGKEATNAKETPVYAMPRMKHFLETNGPWSQLVAQKNIAINELKNELPIAINPSIEVTPFLVPHRDEYSETVGYKIKGPNKTAIFIPDIDKWHLWEKNIIDEIKNVDFAFLDATFYSGKELNNRDISQVPHPFIIESLETFNLLDTIQKNKIIFIHFNHTNPVIDIHSKEAKSIIAKGYKIAQINDIYEL